MKAKVKEKTSTTDEEEIINALNEYDSTMNPIYYEEKGIRSWSKDFITVEELKEMKRIMEPSFSYEEIIASIIDYTEDMGINVKFERPVIKKESQKMKCLVRIK